MAKLGGFDLRLSALAAASALPTGRGSQLLLAEREGSIDFVSDALCEAPRLRALVVVNAFTREALAIPVDLNRAGFAGGSNS